VIKTGYMLAFMLLLAVPARSDLIYVDLPPPEGYFGGINGTTATKSFDLDSNGTVDIEFVAGLEIFGFWTQMPETTRVVTAPGYGIVPMQPGEAIGATLGPTQHPRASLISDSQVWANVLGLGNLSFGFNDGDDVVGGAWHDEATGIGDNAYLGIEFLGDAGTHYGWIHIQEFAGLGGWFYEYAYEDTPGASLIAGVIPEPSSVLLLLLGGACLLSLRRKC